MVSDEEFFNKVVTHLIDEVEKGYVNKKSDRGGMTNWGITYKTYAAYCHRDPKTITEDEMKKMPRSVAVAIYKDMFWDVIRIDDMPLEVRHVAFDMCVNHGPGNAVKLLQRACMVLAYKVTADGKIGPATLSALHSAVIKFGDKELMHAIVDQRAAFYEAIIKNDPVQKANRNGWLARNDWFLTHSLI